MILLAKQKHITSIGGSAVIEGVMMRGPRDIATAVRKPDGEIVVDKKPLNPLVTKYHVNKIPIVRGIFSFFDSMITSVKALMFSAEFFETEEENTKPSKFEAFLERKFGDKLKDMVIYFSVLLSLVLSIALFILLPNYIVGFFKDKVEGNLLKNLIEGIIRIAIFIGYILIVSKQQDIKRVFMYHGAEHKTIFCYENDLELTVENVKKQPRLHPRCGTSFLILVMLISVIFFSFISWDNLATRFLMRIALLPIVAGLSYEVIKWAGRSDNILVRIVSAPGIWLQHITTAEPDEAQIEVAIASMKAVLTGNKEDDKW